MSDLSRLCFLAGAVPYLFLGAAHAWHTPRHPKDRKGLSPRDPGLSEAMTRSTPRLTDRTDIWNAWVGFNYSHSLGAVLFGAFVVLIGRSEANFATEAALATPLALLISLGYLLLGIKYWFRTPIIGIGVSVVLFLAAWTIHLAG